MAFWDVDLTTRMGAESAAHQGALGCFLLGGLTIIAGLFSTNVLNIETLEGQIGIALVALQALVCFIAGFRLRAGKGAWWAIVVALLLVIEMITRLATLTQLPGLIIQVVLLVVVVQGIRGAWALRRQASFDDEDAAAFE